MHVTLRARPGTPPLRAPRIFAAVREAIARNALPGFRVVHFSAQTDHLHLLVEADTHAALGRGMRGLAIRVALGVNRAAGRTGRLWADRWHGRALTTPREVRSALVYVLTNFKKHRALARAVDRRSSGPWFGGWLDHEERPPDTVPCPVVPARTWLLGTGWRQHGLIALAEQPAADRRRRP